MIIKIKHKLPVVQTSGVVEQKPPQNIPSLIGLINQSLRLRDTDLQFFRPSMLHGCPRANVFHYLRVPQNQPALGGYMHRVLDNGTHVHSIIQTYLSENPDIVFAPEVKVHDPDLRIRGSCDGVFFLKSDPNRTLFGIEIKTINESDFAKLKSPKQEHIHQATIYCKVGGLSGMIILYWSKNRHELKEYFIEPDANVWELVQKLCESFLSSATEYETSGDPQTLPKFDKKVCRSNFTFCKMSKHCYSLMPGEEFPGRNGE